MNELFINKLNIINFRNLSNKLIIFDRHMNEISGTNASGKTTILDSIKYIIFGNKKVKNFSKISPKDDITIYPNIELTLVYNDSEITLSTKNKKWFINNIAQKNFDSYQKTFSNLIGKIDINDELYNIVVPNELEEKILSEKQVLTNNQNEIRTSLISIANSLSTEKKIDIELFNKIISDINNVKDLIRTKNNDIRIFNDHILQMEEHYKDSIKDWEIYGEDDEKIIKEKIDELTKVQTEVNSKISTINCIKNKREVLENNILDIQHSKNQVSIQKNILLQDEIDCDIEEKESVINPKSRKNNVIKIILLSILTFGIYLLFYFRNKKKINNKNINKKSLSNTFINESESITSDLIKLQESLNNKTNEIEKLNKEIEKKESEKNELIEKYGSFDEISYEIQKLKNRLKNNDVWDEVKIKYKSIKKQIEDHKNEVLSLTDKLNFLLNDKTRISQETDKLLRKQFPNFKIKLFDNDNNEQLLIEYDSVPWKYLNHAKKMNILYEINSYLCEKYKLRAFNLIDFGESINEIYSENNIQIIVAKVTKDQLKLNGKNIN